MNAFFYISSSHSSDPHIIEERIKYYLETEDFEITSDQSSTHVVFDQDITKEQLFKLDVTMSSLGYVRP